MAPNILILQLSCLLVVAVGFASADEPEKIISGQDAAPGEFPHMVSIREYDRHFCGGAIISPNHILTAAHCLHRRRNYTHDVFSVVSGTIQLKGDGEAHSVSKLFIHPEFDPKRVWVHDVAVIKLASPITFNSLQQPIRLPTAEPRVNVLAIVTGWGFNGIISSTKPPLVLQKLHGVVINKKVCQAAGPSFELIKENICMVSPVRQGVCYGDSGSPMIYEGEVIGIVSTTVSCASKYPDIYAMVYGHLKFIRESMSK